MSVGIARSERLHLISARASSSASARASPATTLRQIKESVQSTNSECGKRLSVESVIGRHPARFGAVFKGFCRLRNGRLCRTNDRSNKQEYYGQTHATRAGGLAPSGRAGG